MLLPFFIYSLYIRLYIRVTVINGNGIYKKIPLVVIVALVVFVVLVGFRSYGQRMMFFINT
jgi:hypothetical protein